MLIFSPQKWPFAAQAMFAFILGAISVLAFAPFELGLFSLFALTFLLHLLWFTNSVRRAALLGFFFGLGLMGFGVFWLRISIGQFGGVVPALAVAITLLLVFIMALYFALAAWLSSHLKGRHSKSIFMLVIFPACWVLLEWLRATLFSGFPWLSMGYSQLDQPLAGFAPVVGTYGVGFLLVFSAGLLNVWRLLWPPVLFACLWVAGLGLSWASWTEATGEPIKVSLLQANIAQEDKWKRDMLQPTLALYQSMTEQARDSDLVIWPETAIPAFDSQVEESLLQPLHQMLVAENRDLLSGIVIQKVDGRYYNAMLSLGISGRESYLKRHLVPFGEFLPLKSLLDPVLDFLQIPMSNFAVGEDNPPLIKLAGQVAGINICYEDAFATDVMRALPEATFLINASNDAWFGDSLAPHQHLQIARMRALETGRYLLRATNTGVSAIIDHRGEVRGSIPQFTQASLTDRIQPRQGMTPYAISGDWLVLLLSGLMLLGTVLLGRSGTKVGVTLDKAHP